MIFVGGDTAFVVDSVNAKVIGTVSGVQGHARRHHVGGNMVCLTY